MAYLLEARVDELIKFAEDEGVIQCAAATRSGQRCRTYLDRLARPFEEWLAIERAGTARCHRHRDVAFPANEG